MTDKRITWKQGLLQDWEIKLMALVLAVAVWYAVRDATGFEMVIRDIKIDVQLKDGMAILDQSAASVNVTFRGSQSDIQALDPKRIRAVIDLRSKSTATTELLTISPHALEGARGVTAIDINPHRIRFVLDREEEKLLPVKGRITGRPMAGDVDDILCEPDAVLLRGPARRLQWTDVVYTQPVDVDGRVASFIKRVPVMPPSESWPVRIKPTEVQVRIAISASTAKRVWTNLPVTVLSHAGGRPTIMVQPSQVDVTLGGPSEELKSIGDQELKVFVDCGGLAPPAKYDLPVHVYRAQKDGVTASAVPSSVHVTLED